MAETVGSVIGISVAGGRNTHTSNFQKEVKLRFNLPPLHILSQRLIPELVEQICLRQDFFRRGDEVKKQLKKMKFATSSASIGNMRILYATKTHTPVNFFI